MRKAFSVFVRIAVAPEVAVYGVEDMLNAGDDVSLTCNVHKGDTPLSIRWTFHGDSVMLERQFTTLPAGARTNILMIQSVQHAHSGTYTCIASNAVGEASYSTKLVVKGMSATVKLSDYSFPISFLSRPSSHPFLPRLFISIRVGRL